MKYNHPLIDFSKLILEFEIDYLFKKIISQENVNVKVADISCQLLLLSQQFDTKLNEVLNAMFVLYKANASKENAYSEIMLLSERYVSSTMDIVISELMENYPLLFNQLFDYHHYVNTGSLRLSPKEQFMSQFTSPVEIENHYDLIASDQLILTLTNRYSEILACMLGFYDFNKISHLVFKRIADFFYVLYTEVVRYFSTSNCTFFHATSETKVNAYGDHLMIFLEECP